MSTAVSIFILIWIKDQEHETNESTELIRETNRKISFSIHDYIFPPAFLPALMVLFNGIIFSSITNFLAIYGLSKGITNVGLFFTINSVVMLASRPIMGKVADSKPASYIIIPGIISATLACVVIASADSIIAISVAAVLYGLGFGSCQSAIQIMAIKSASPKTRGIANSTFFVGGDIGLSLGSALAGILAYRVGYENMYLVMAAISLFSIFVFFVYSKALKKA